ncbi:hypothetical protein [Paenibacillus montanisoli]|uniref:Uncharacterized protein n=1 Tax=Paenibacillus montanisoli TaxID=2081970 RepID=A0A328U3R4_9BACL|nr:hypothetical protein [Paenibacillus montanisoli]RAP76101.1 hypothetical protein DL346_11810 [Paenibacillus montanisoli]
MNQKWKLYDGFYGILVEVDGDKVLDEIIKHFDENNPNSTEKTLILDMYSLERNASELLKFQRRVNYYGELGYTILLTS